MVGQLPTMGSTSTTDSRPHLLGIQAITQRELRLPFCLNRFRLNRIVLMATTGSSAWSKYYQGKGDLETVVKKDSPTYDGGGTPTGKKLSAGTKVIALATRTYEAKTPVKVIGTGELCRISLDALVKPGKKGAAASTINLKPQAFGIKDTIEYGIDAYVKQVRLGLEDSALPTKLKAYLLALVEYYCKEITQTELAKYDVSDFPVNDIEKDFGEVLGPIALINYSDVAKKKGIELDRQSKIFVPSRPNEPLMDYKMIGKKRSYLVSAKTQGTSNTVKPKDILELLAKDPEVLKKWKKTKEYAVLDILADSKYNTIQAPLAVAFQLSKDGDRDFSGFSKKQPDLAGMNKQKNVVSPDILVACSAFINSNNYLKALKRKPTATELNYEVEKKLVEWSKKNKPVLTKLFLDAVGNRVKYVKFSGIARKSPSFEFVAEEKMAENGVEFRSKSGYTRSADKLGIQT